MTDTLQLFDSKGRWLCPSPEAVAALSESKRERFEVLKTEALKLEELEQALKDEQAKIPVAMQAIAAAKQMLPRPPTSTESAKAWIASQRGA